MNTTDFTAVKFPSTDLNLYMEMGNYAIRGGDEKECLKWYCKGLARARELKNREKEQLFSNLIITLI